jgi:hypothetical protein
MPVLFAAVTVLACLLDGSHALAANQKLFLKDGTYELVSSYEVHGDRVRYYSTERGEWEEIPLALVDLEATKRAQEEEKGVQKKQLEEGLEIERQRFYKPVETGFEIAPGVHLPSEEGVYAYDGMRVIRLIQSSAEIVTDKRRAALARAVPGRLLKSNSIVVLSGARAAVRIQNAVPTFYVQSAEGVGAKLELVRLKVVEDSRVVEKVEADRSGMAKPSEVRPALEFERTQLAPGLYRLTLLHSLDPGEYALGELDPQKVNLQFWPFGLFETPRPPSKQQRKNPPPSESEQPEQQ